MIQGRIELLKRERERVRPPQVGWLCPNCGQRVSEVMEICPYCERSPRPAPPEPAPQPTRTKPTPRPLQPQPAGRPCLVSPRPIRKDPSSWLCP